MVARPRQRTTRPHRNHDRTLVTWIQEGANEALGVFGEVSWIPAFQSGPEPTARIDRRSSTEVSGQRARSSKGLTSPGTLTARGPLAAAGSARVRRPVPPVDQFCIRAPAVGDSTQKLWISLCVHRSFTFEPKALVEAEPSVADAKKWWSGVAGSTPWTR